MTLLIAACHTPGSLKILIYHSKEKLPNGKNYLASYRKDYTFMNSEKYTVPENHFF